MSPAGLAPPEAATRRRCGGRGWTSADARDQQLFTDITFSENIDFIHHENDYNDYEKQPLLPHKLSATGPDIAVGDVNNDGIEDFFIGNALHSKGAMFLQTRMVLLTGLPVPGKMTAITKIREHCCLMLIRMEILTFMS